MKHAKFLRASSLLLAIGIAASSLLSFGQGAKPREYVPDENTAIAIGLAILRPIYGDKMIEKHKPFSAVAQGEIWVIKGRVKLKPGKVQNGGVMEVKISKADARVLSVRLGIWSRGWPTLRSVRSYDGVRLLALQVHRQRT